MCIALPIRNKRLWYNIQNIPNSESMFLSYTDAAFADREDKKSTSGYVIIAAGSAITWKSGKQGLTAQSNTGAEYIGLWVGGQEASWLRNLNQELGNPQRAPKKIYCDNKSPVLAE